MASSKWRFCRILPASQVALATVFGGWGLWQRNRILSHDYLFGTGWNSTARFHVWPWPYKFAAISNLPALFAGLLLTIPISVMKPTISETLQLAPTLVFVFLLWVWIGARLDRRWSVADRTPWIAILLFVVFSSVGAYLPLGYTGFLPYGLAVWVVAYLALSRSTRVCSVPHDSRTR
jgi:hypothetical protein